MGYKLRIPKALLVQRDMIIECDTAEELISMLAMWGVYAKPKDATPQTGTSEDDRRKDSE